MKIHCLQHKESYVHFIFLKEKQVEFLCDECQTNMQEQNQHLDFSKLININKALSQPEYLTCQIVNSQILKTFLKDLYQNDEKNIDILIDELDSIIQGLQIQLINVQKELYFFNKSYNQFRQQIREQLEYAIRFDQFKYFIDNLKQDSTINPQKISEIQRNLYIYFNQQSKENLKSTQNKIFTFLEKKNEYMNQVNDYCNEFNTLQELYKEFHSKYTSLKNKIIPKFPETIPNTQLLEKEFQPKIIETITQYSKKKINKINLIFKGNKSVLNAQNFWYNVDGKDNLLIVFSLQNDTVFGAYSPCKWMKSETGQYVKDETSSSFLFSQKYNEIYPIKQESNDTAIFCNSKYGPIFGGKSIFIAKLFNYYSTDTNDLQISSDFKIGISSIGTTYQINSSEKQNTLPFGQLESKITMCEIFQVSFI